MKRVLVTGGCGFLGAAFVRYLLEAEQAVHVVNFDFLTYAAQPERLDDLKDSERYAFVRGDVADPLDLGKMWDESGPFDTVFHFAAETHVDRSLIDATPFVRTNVAGTQVMLDAMRAQQSGLYVHISTDEVYGPVESGTYLCEDARLAPRNPYAATKAAADHLALAYGRSYGLDVKLVRSVNVYGPGQYPEKFVPLSVASLQNGEPIPLYGDGEQVRDWLYVEDYVRAVLTVAGQGTMGEIYHVSARDERPNREVAESICALMNVPVKDGITHVEDRPGHDRRYGLDASKLRGLGWLPEVDFGSGLRRTIEWFREHPQKPAPARGGEQ